MLLSTLAVVCVVPSGNTKPPEVELIIPVTTSGCPGLDSPIPTFPFFRTVTALFLLFASAPFPITKRGSVAIQSCVVPET